MSNKLGLHIRLDQPRFSQFAAMRKQLQGSIENHVPTTDIGKQLENITAPLLSSYTLQIAADEQRRAHHAALHQYSVGDGLTSIVDDPITKSFNRMATSFDQLIDFVNQIATDLPFQTEAERIAEARKRSREDLRSKSRELRKRKGYR